MPVHPSISTTRISQRDFKSVARKVMRHVFDLHNEFGRLFDELIYKRDLAARLPGVVLEAAVTASHGSFEKTYFLDVLVDGSGLFEFKAVDALHPRHRGQTLNYLLLFDLAHGKLINVHTDRVEHEFVNCPNRLINLRNPQIIDTAWNPRVAGADAFRDLLTALIKDWGVGLEMALYNEAITHLLGGDQVVLHPVPVFGKRGYLVDQPMRLVTPNVAFRITAIHEGTEGSMQIDTFAVQLRKLLEHTNLEAIHWANLTHHQITFTTLQPI